MSVITLTTDFGTHDWFVGTVKGVILGINPDARLVDITHEIPDGDIRAGAFTLMASFAFFPPGTVHLVVVDPGVGSARAPIAVQTEKYVFVGPDNGVLSLALERDRPRAVHRLENQALFLPHVSRTFHGRDVFGPAAAHLSKGTALAEVGPRQEQYVQITLPQPKAIPGQVHGSVIYIDRFGNAITNLAAELSILTNPRAQVRVPGRKSPLPIRSFYQAVPEGQPLAVIGSSGFLEITINGGSAGKTLGLKIGDGVILTLL